MDWISEAQNADECSKKIDLVTIELAGKSKTSNNFILGQAIMHHNMVVILVAFMISVLFTLCIWFITVYFTVTIDFTFACSFAFVLTLRITTSLAIPNS